MKDIITRENETAIFMTNYKNTLDEVEEFAEVKRSPYFDLLKMLIREGYLDETYPDYMTYFYENSITANDKAFIRSVTDRRKKSFDYPLNNAALVISRMRAIDFKKEEALNFELLEQLLSDVKRYNEQLINFLEMISNIEPVEFVSQFLERNIAREKFVREFNKYWPGANKWILSEDGFSLPQKKQYVLDTLCVSFIIKNIEKYTEIMDRTMFLSSELLLLLEEEISDELKLRLLRFETKPISIRNKKYSARVKEYILKNLYSSEDFPYLLKEYPSYKAQLQRIILDMAIRAICQTEELPCAVNIRLFEQLMQTDQIDDKDKQGLLIQQIRAGIDKRAMKVAFEQLGLTEYNGILEGQSGKVSATSKNEQILKALLERKWIKHYSQNEEEPALFQVYGKAAHTKDLGLSITL